MQAELHGVLPVHKSRFEPLQKSAFRWSNRLKQAVAVCNSLTYVNKGTVAGADMERSMFKAVEARFLVPASLAAAAAAAVISAAAAADAAASFASGWRVV